jgi:ABC-type Na+ efflux pump permease subunit
MAVWTLAKKELRLLLRDRRAALILLALPLVFILVLGLLLGESFGQKPDDRLRFSIVDLDEGFALDRFPFEPWSKVVERDLAETAGIRLDMIASRAEAERVIEDHKRAAVLILEPTFSEKVARCSFLVDGINPFHRDGVYLDRIDATLLKDQKQPGGAAISEQVAQVTLLRVILPWMIGRAFERLSEPEFIKLLGDEVRLPVPKGAEFLFTLKGIKLQDGKASLSDALRVAAPDEKTQHEYQFKVGAGVQNALREQFRKYNLTGKTWAALTKSTQDKGEKADVAAYADQGGFGMLHRGAHRYQVLVPSYTVMFAFFLVMTVGWLFVSERRQGTLKRLRAAPLSHTEILLGKLLPCCALSLGQGVFLLVAGRLVFGMRWGPENWSIGQQIVHLLPIVFTTSLAAMGLALLVAALARTEIQVALYGALPVLVLALIGGCVLPPELMPEQAQQFSLFTPQGQALAAYRELLDPDPHSKPNLAIVYRSSVILAGFGIGFLALAWYFMKLDE